MGLIRKSRSHQLFKDGLAHGANRKLKLFNVGIRRHPAGIDVQLGNLTVIAVEESNEVFCEITLIVFVQRADDTAVDTDILRVMRMIVANENITRMHIRMEKAVAKHLGKEDLHPTLRKQLHVGALGFQRSDVGNRNTVDPLHHHHAFATVIGIDFRHV